MKWSTLSVVIALSSRGLPGADCNGNGVDDAADIAPGEYRLLAPPSYELPGSGEVVLADLNGDGRLDLVRASGYCSVPDLEDLLNASLEVALNHGDGTFEAPRAFSLASVTLTTGSCTDLGYQLSLVDLSGDGRPDLVGFVPFISADVLIALNDGSGAFPSAEKLSLPEPPLSLASADLDSDGDVDLIFVASFRVLVLINQGNATFVNGPETTVGSGPTSIDAVDLDLDGQLDIATANGSSGTLSILLGDGQGAFGPPRNYATGVNPNSIVAG